MAEAPEIRGSCDPRFAEVKRAFARNFEDGLEIGACFAATIDGEFVVDLWAGHADQDCRHPWEQDTIVNVYSRAFFWGGWGGSLVVIDLDARLSFSYVMNKMGSGPIGHARAFRPAAALYRSL
jgi:CubicO group peptidase (beta-lactamase class C family)